MRLFIAINVTPEVKNTLKTAQDSWKAKGIRGNFTPEENLHLTLAFIGEYPDPDEILDVMESVQSKPFTMRIDGFGNFDDLWWAGVHKSAELEAVVRQLRHLLSERHLPFEAGRFRAHITFLRRAVFQSDSLPPLSGKGSRMTVGEIVLYRSDRGKHGPVYTPLGSVQAEQTE